MSKNCLNCKYEPEWGEVVGVGGAYPRQHGDCKYIVNLPPLPSTVVVDRAQKIVRHSDDSGIHRHCKVWEPKDEADADNNTDN